MLASLSTEVYQAIETVRADLRCERIVLARIRIALPNYQFSIVILRLVGGVFSRMDANVLDWTANGEPLPLSSSFILNNCRLVDLGKVFIFFTRISSSIGNGF